MNTSLLFVELVIIGAQALVWICLLISLLANKAIDITAIKDYETIFIVVSVALSYTVGIFFDRLADNIFSPLNNILKKRIIPDPDPNIGTMRYLIANDNEYLNKFLEYTRSRMRIARASSINFPLIMFILVVYLNVFYGISITLDLILYSFGGFFSIISYTSWKNITITHLELIKNMYDKTKCVNGD